MLWRDPLTALNLGVLNKMVFGTDYPGVRQRLYLDMLMSFNRCATHKDLKISENQISAILDENVAPPRPKQSITAQLT